MNLQQFSKNDIEKLLSILKKFGANVDSLAIRYKLITEQDIQYLVSFFPNIKNIVIRGDYLKKKKSVPRVIFGQKNQPLRLVLLDWIDFDSNILQFNSIFENIQLTEKFKSLNVTIPEPSKCFAFLKNNSSIENLSITSNQSVSIPISHLKLKSLSLRLPKLKQNLDLVEQQTHLEKLDVIYEADHEVQRFAVNNTRGNLDLLRRLVNMKNLTNLSFCIDEILDDDFDHLSSLSKLKQLCVTSEKSNKVRTFSTVSVPSVTRMLLYFKRLRVPNNQLISIAKNFPNVNDLVYDGKYFCDAFYCFAGNLNSLGKLLISMTLDYEENYHDYMPSHGTETKIICTSLKSLSLYLSCPDEKNMHNFMIRLALSTTNLENLLIETDSMKIIHNNFIYILRNLKKLKNVNLSYDLFPNESEVGSMVDLEQYGKSNELQIINTLKEYSANLEFVEMSLSSPNDLNEELWNRSFCHQFASIKIEDTIVTMKKDPKISDWNMFA